jgi:hypothetical protein
MTDKGCTASRCYFCGVTLTLACNCGNCRDHKAASMRVWRSKRRDFAICEECYVPTVVSDHERIIKRRKGWRIFYYPYLDRIKKNVIVTKSRK